MGMGELMASYTFAQKKTMKSMTVAYEQLLGAAVMNNTYCLFIFLILIATQGLYWNYSFPTCLTSVIILVKFNSIHFSIIKSHFFKLQFKNENKCRPIFKSTLNSISILNLFSFIFIRHTNEIIFIFFFLLLIICLN